MTRELTQSVGAGVGRYSIAPQVILLLSSHQARLRVVPDETAEFRVRGICHHYGRCDDGAVTSLSERAREQVSATATEREGVKPPRGGPRASEGASRWELLMELECAYSLIAELAEKVERLEVEIKRAH